MSLRHQSTMFQSLKGLQRLWIKCGDYDYVIKSVFQSLKGLQRLWIMVKFWLFILAIRVSIPKRASEALNLASVSFQQQLVLVLFQSLKGLQRLWIFLRFSLLDINCHRLKVSIPKRASEALNQKILCNTVSHTDKFQSLKGLQRLWILYRQKLRIILNVSIPKRASEALNLSQFWKPATVIPVSIPKRASEALNLSQFWKPATVIPVSIPKRASEALNPTASSTTCTSCGVFQSLKGLQRLWISAIACVVSSITLFQSLKGLQRLWILIASFSHLQNSKSVSIPKRASEALNL